MTEQQPPAGQTPPGFYPDQTGTMRYWDGQQWTDRTPPAPKQRHTFRNVMLAIIAFCVLFIAGCFALVGGAVNEVDKSITEAEKRDQEPGGPDNPLRIEEGKAFSVLDFDYADGWKIAAGEFGGIDVTGLKVTNNRDEKDSSIVEIKFMQGDEVLALVDCTTEPVAVGQTTTVDCGGADDLPDDYEYITVNDTF